MEPLVSIIIPARNAERYIAEAIGSAISQTWPRKEIIVVDDGSTDRTLEIAKRFASNQLTVIAQNNAGAATARNKGLSICQGEYIQYLDADDQLGPEKVERQLANCEANSSKRVLLSSAWGYFLRRTDRAEFTPSPLWCDLTPAEWLVRKMEQNLFMQTATWLVSRELTDAAGPWNEKLSLDDDGEYFCRVLLASEGTQFTPEAKVFYRIPGFGGLSIVGQTNKKLESQFTSMRLHVKYLQSLEDSERVRSASIRFLQNWLIHFYPERPDLVNQARQMAIDLGGELSTPQLPWKYAWIQKLFGWTAAKRTQRVYNQTKSAIVGSIENISGMLWPQSFARGRVS